MAVVADEAQLPEFVHEMTDARARGADDLGQRLVERDQLIAFRVLITVRVEDPGQLRCRFPLLDPSSECRTVYEVDVGKNDIDCHGLQYRLGLGYARRLEDLKTLLPEIGCLGGS